MAELWHKIQPTQLLPAPKTPTSRNPENENDWLQQRALELKLAVDQNGPKRFYELTKELYGPSTQSSAPLRSKDGTTLIRDQKARMERWKEHYSDLLNQSSEVNEDMLNNIEQCEVMEDLAAPPTLPEVEEGIASLQNGNLLVTTASQ